MRLQGPEKWGMDRPVVPPPSIKSAPRHPGRERISPHALQRIQVTTSTVGKLDKVVESVPCLANILHAAVAIELEVELFDFRCCSAIPRELGD